MDPLTLSEARSSGRRRGWYHVMTPGRCAFLVASGSADNGAGRCAPMIHTLTAHLALEAT